LFRGDMVPYAVERASISMLGLVAACFSLSRMSKDLLLYA
jgi:hypothetical protein